MTLLATVGRKVIDAVRYMGRCMTFLCVSVFYGFVRPFKFRTFLQQIQAIGSSSISIIVVTGGFTGMVLGLQGYYTLSKFGAQGLLGSAVALSIIRELGPVLAGLMVTGRAGSAMTAEIGIMKMTEQMNALEMMAVNPVKHVVTPKIFAALISLPILTAIFDLVGIGGGYLVGVKLLGVNEGAYFGQMIAAVEFVDIYGGLVKSVAFGLIIAWFCSFIGYTAVGTTEGVAKATTNAVVSTSVMILISDYILTSFLL